LPKRCANASAAASVAASSPGTPLRSEIEARGAPGLEAATDAAAGALAQRFGDGAIEGRIRALVISAARPR